MRKQLNIRTTDADQRLITALKKRYGLTSTAELIRMALKALQEQKQ
jgi:hypothetical protein